MLLKSFSITFDSYSIKSAVILKKITIGIFNATVIDLKVYVSDYFSVSLYSGGATEPIAITPAAVQ